MQGMMGDEHAALLALLRHLAGAGYVFVTPTPATHARVVARRSRGRDLRDVFGWSLPFSRRALPADLFDTLVHAGAIVAEGGLWRSRVRVSSLAGRLFVHSAYPTDAADAVFFGPDTYRFARFLAAELPQWAGAGRLVDLGCGSGAGGIVAGSFLPEARMTLVDVNPLALRYASVNAEHAGLAVEALEADRLDGVEGAIHLVIANPPYMVDAGNRAYRHGGGMHGAELSLEWALAAAERVTPGGGGMLLYTASAIVEGRDPLREALEAELPRLGCTLRYEELDPDVFGEQLDEPAYADAERIAVVGVVIRRS